jgi:5-hydroxyisourate hydrolase-like protein (transthyretin family)
MRLRASTTVLFVATWWCAFLAVFPDPSLAQDTPSTQATTSPRNSSDPDGQLCTVAGTVTSVATGEPLKKVEIALSPESPDTHPRPRTVLTDANGAFSLDHVVPGRYYLAVRREGYLTQQYGQKQDNGEDFGAVLSLTAGQKITDLIFRLQKTAVITGRVVDEDGDPIIRASVEVLRRRVVNGSRRFEPMGSEATDDQGVYRIFDLPPGHYFVRVNPLGPKGSIRMSPDDEQPPDPKSAYPETYFPGTTDSSRASVLEVKAGDEIPRIDFFLAPQAGTKTYRIRGHVTNALGAQTEGSITVMAFPRNSEEENSFGRYLAQPDGKTSNFTIEGLVPGPYTVTAFSFGGQRAHSAIQEIEITNSDVDSVSLVVTRGAEISGRVFFEGQTASDGENLLVALESRSIDFPYFGSSQAKVKGDGTFVISDVGDGTYSIRVYSSCHQCYLKSATAGGIDLLAQHLTVASGSGESNLELLYSSNTGKASGVVAGADGLPVPGAYVMLVRDRDSPDAASDSKATTDQNGRFEIEGVPPGRYRAVAFAKTGTDSADFDDPDFVKPFADKAESFEISAGSTTNLQLAAVMPNETGNTN